MFGKIFAGLGNRLALALEIIGDRVAQTGMGDVMRRMRRHGEIATRQLVLALRPGLYAVELLCNRKVDGLMIADLEMQEGVILDAAPVPAVKRILADEIDRAAT